jgi:hypothetical protein
MQQVKLATGATVLDESKTLGEEVYGRLRSDLIAGRLLPETKLPFRQLSVRYGVGIAPLREALSRLASERLVQFEGNRGYAQRRQCLRRVGATPRPFSPQSDRVLRLSLASPFLRRPLGPVPALPPHHHHEDDRVERPPRLDTGTAPDHRRSKHRTRCRSCRAQPARAFRGKRPLRHRAFSGVRTHGRGYLTPTLLTKGLDGRKKLNIT